MIVLTNAREEFNNYSGNEKKKTLFYDEIKYLVKFPDPFEKDNNVLRFINNTYSEYIGSIIFSMVGIPTQEVTLAKYKYNDKIKIVCACRDFTDINHVLYEFNNIALGINPDKKIDTEISDIIDVINHSNNLIDSNEVTNRFYDMFIIDALIGNTDRHNGDWGFIYDRDRNMYDFAKIFDCGSCLNPLLDDEDIKKLSDGDVKNLAINVYSCLKVNNKRINFFNYIKEMKDNKCNDALLRIFNKIDIDAIESFIDNIETISNDRKKFYKDIIRIRYNILANTYKKLSA